MGGRHRKSKRFGVELALNSPGPKVKPALTIDHLDGWQLRLSPGEKRLPRKKCELPLNVHRTSFHLLCVPKT